MPSSDRKTPTADLSALLEELLRANVEFILVGGLAAVIQGAPVTTMDADIVHRQSTENISKLFAFLESIHAAIGLPNEGPRACDVEARAMLGRPRGSSVFPAPIRPMLSAVSHAHASRIGRENDGRGLMIQCWHILPKIHEIDAHLRRYPSDRARDREIHPEVSFMIMAGRPMTHPKRKKAGRLERLALLKPVFGDGVGEAIQNRRALGAKPDDIIDAFAALWSARRFFDHSSISLPSASQQTDSKGIIMEIVA